MSNALITNYFGTEEAIVERLKTELGTLVKDVLTPFSITDMVESSQSSPSIHVIYAGDNIKPSESSNGQARVVAQRWLVVLAVRSPKAQLQQTSDARKTAGGIIPKLLESLQGWTPAQYSRPLSRVAGAPPAGYTAAFAYFPFLFESVIIL